MRFPFLDLKALNQPYMAEIKEAVSNVIESGRYIGGPEVVTLEQNMCRLCDAPFAVAVSNGLDALRLILRAYKELGTMADGDEIIVPANTYIATILAITDNNLVPVLVDVDPRSMNIDTSKIEQSITSRTRAIMPVHLYGRVAWDDKLKEVAERYNLKVVEDSAQSIGASSSTQGLYGSNMAGALGDASGFSFYPTKNVGAMGDAGMVVTHDEALAKTVRTLSNYGSDRRYHNIYAGLNCRLDPIQAAVLNVKLRYIDRENNARIQRAKLYNELISNPGVVLPAMPDDDKDCVWHQYVVRVHGHRDDFMAFLAENGVGTDIHYAVPPHRQPCYSGLLKYDNLAVTESLADEIVSLPISSATSPEDIADIAEIINRFTI